MSELRVRERDGAVVFEVRVVGIRAADVRFDFG
jgi:hypothetical protein